MVSLQPPVCDFGWKAHEFNLRGVDGKRYTPKNTCGKNGLLVMFICNHCPYVKSIRDRIVRDTRELLQYGINSIAIMSNDSAEYEEDSFENMQKVAQQYAYPFPYVWDETQQIARITEQFARQISSDLMLNWNCNTVADWMPRARRRCRMYRVICLMPWCKWRKRARDH